MGYFDSVDDKIENIQEVGEIEQMAGVAFWYSIGSLGMLLHTIVLCSLLGWTSVYAGIPYLVSIAFSIVGLVYVGKSRKAASLVRAKNELNSMACAYNILWLLISISLLAINTGFSFGLMFNLF